MRRSPDCHHTQLSTGRVWQAGKAETMVFEHNQLEFFKMVSKCAALVYAIIES